MPTLAPIPSISAARCHGLIASPVAVAAGAVSASNRAIAAATAAASSFPAIFSMPRKPYALRSLFVPLSDTCSELTHEEA